MTMTNFYRRLSNCQPHHTVQISAVSTTVLTTTTTTHNTALGTMHRFGLALALINGLCNDESSLSDSTMQIGLSHLSTKATNK
jgi:hypothetical protein